MEGRHGPMEITDLVELVDRNKYRPNIRWISSRWGPRKGAPAGTVTCLVGAYLFGAYGQMPKDHETAYNIPTPFIPEHTIGDPKTGKVIARGWRPILEEMIQLRTIRPSRELEKILGEEAFKYARYAAGTLA